MLRKCLNLNCLSVCSGRIPLTSNFFLSDTALAEFPMLLPKGNIHSSPERTSETGRWLLFTCLIHSQWYWLMHEPNICATLDWFSLSCIELILIQNEFSLVIAIIWFRPAGFFVQIRVESDKTPTFAKPSTFAADWADPCMYSNTSSSTPWVGGWNNLVVFRRLLGQKESAQVVFCCCFYHYLAQKKRKGTSNSETST